MMYLEYDWTFNVYRFRFGDTFTSVLDIRSCGSMAEAKDLLQQAKLKVGRKTDSRTWKIEAACHE